jgi:hypothetical protein
MNNSLELILLRTRVLEVNYVSYAQYFVMLLCIMYLTFKVLNVDYFYFFLEFTQSMWGGSIGLIKTLYNVVYDLLESNFDLNIVDSPK